jgi:hypothetical protein
MYDIFYPRFLTRPLSWEEEAGEEGKGGSLAFPLLHYDVTGV